MYRKIAFITCLGIGQASVPIDPHEFCKHVTGNEHSYCKDYQSPPLCQGSDALCTPEAISSYRTRSLQPRGPAAVSAGIATSTETGNPWDGITMGEQDAYCRSRTPGSYCKITRNSSVCHGSNADCSKQSVYLANISGSTSAASTTRSTSTTTRSTTTTTRTTTTTTRSTTSTTRTTRSTTTRSSSTTTTSTTTPITTTVTTPDPCRFTDAKLIGRSPTTGDAYYMPVPSLRACMMNTKISHANAIWTLHNLHYGVAESYSFTDLVKDTTASVETNACNHRVHPVRVDLVGEIRAEIAQYDTLFSTLTKAEIDAYLLQERPAYPFHKKLVVLMNKLHDAHTLYSTPYTMFRVYSPINFGSRMVDGNQVITLRTSSSVSDPLGRLRAVYTRVFGQSGFPIDDSRNGAVITHINGMTAIDFIRNLTSDTGLLAASYQQQEQRMNAYIFSTPLLVFGQVLSYLPDFDSFELGFEDGAIVRVNLLGQFSDLSTSPYYVVPNLRQTTTLSTYLHTNEAFNAFISHEENIDAKKPTLWKSAAAAAAMPGFHGRRFQSSANAERWRLLSKKHKALLDPINNLKRDNLLNIPAMDVSHGGDAIEHDDLWSEDGVEPVAPFADADTLARVIKDSLAADDRASQSVDASAAVSASGSFTNMGGMSYKITGDTVIITIPSFVPEPQSASDEEFYFFPEFIEIQKMARAQGVTRLLIDLTDNGGGYVMSAYAMLWYLLSDPSRICAPLYKRITPNWSQWIDTFGDGVPSIVARYLAPQGDALADKLDSIFTEITSVVTVLFDGLGLTSDQIGSTLTKSTALARVSAKKAQISALSSRTLKARAIRDYLSAVGYIPDEIPARNSLIQTAGLAPFDPYEMIVPDTRGRVFSPLLSNFKRTIHKNWGPDGSRVSQLGEFGFCYEVMNHMPSVTAPSGGAYTRNYWTQVAIVTDGTCGSACSLFSTLMTTNGDAVAFSYGGQANTAMDISSFCGGNVLEYNDVMQSTALARKIASLSSQRLSPYDRAHNETFVDTFIAMPTKASARLNWNMAMMETHMSRSQDGINGEVYSFDPLPRQMYLVPARMHINRWAPDAVTREGVYGDVIGIANWGTVVAQFKDTHGQCPKEVTPFVYRATSRFL